MTTNRVHSWPESVKSEQKFETLKVFMKNIFENIKKN